MGQRWRCCAGRAADECAQAGLQFAEIEGLGQVIVGAGIQAADLVGAGCRARSGSAPALAAAAAQLLQHASHPGFGRPRSSTQAS
jgi:hypothetical protein